MLASKFASLYRFPHYNNHLPRVNRPPPPLPALSTSALDLSTRLRIDPLPQDQGPLYDVHKGVLSQGDAEVPVTVKIFRTSMDEQKNTLIYEHYLREIRARESLAHDYPHITEVMGTATIGGKPAIVIRSYTGGDAAEYIRLHPHSKVDLIISVVQVVKYLHTHHPQLVHGDLKLSNIVVDDNGRALIGSLASSHIPGFTKYTVGQVGASYRWMAPELIVDEGDDTRPPTFESDMWAFACVIAQLITGIVPYQFRRYTFQVVPSIAKGVLPYNKTSFIDTANACGINRSEGLWQVLEQCWEKDPTRRPTVTQFESSLRGVFEFN
ncbi:hypothetical protein JAAARDRAFT_525237 [Jaapia argillacea MUCL 33604]|uniref:Protein kinase domain-containing protein n=1 Tax=Jaapia argillacea MUCL 33604 TaxID=933084 RepID=A0A067Q494_9AGAM|nr:hypothetical protein JAAARDRAFT_525237 [Jaapia argillacea MUCL 33604]